MTSATRGAVLILIAIVLGGVAAGFLWNTFNPATEPDGMVDTLPTSSRAAVSSRAVSSAAASSVSSLAEEDASSSAGTAAASSAAPAPSSAAGSAMSAEAGLNASKTVVTVFQAWVTFPGSPMRNRAYDGNPYMTDAFRTRLAAWTDEATDPLTCAPKDPPAFQVIDVKPAGSAATVRLRETYPDTTVELDVRLVRNDGMWLIDGVDCPVT